MNESKENEIDNGGARSETKCVKNEIKWPHPHGVDVSMMESESNFAENHNLLSNSVVKIDNAISKGTKIKLEIDCDRNAKRLKTEEGNSNIANEAKEPKLDEEVVANVNAEKVKKEDNSSENVKEPMKTDKESGNIFRSTPANLKIKIENDLLSSAEEVKMKGPEPGNIVKSSSGNHEMKMVIDTLNVPNDVDNKNTSNDVNIINEVETKIQESNFFTKSPSGNANVEIKNENDVTNFSIIAEVKAKDQVKSEEQSVESSTSKTPGESDCGITEFIGKHTGFNTILKHR